MRVARVEKTQIKEAAEVAASKMIDVLFLWITLYIEPPAIEGTSKTSSPS